MKTLIQLPKIKDHFFFVNDILMTAQISHAVELEARTLTVLVDEEDVKKARRALFLVMNTIDMNQLSIAHRFLYQPN